MVTLKFVDNPARPVEIPLHWRVPVSSCSSSLRGHVFPLLVSDLLATALDGPVALLGFHVLEAVDQGKLLLFGCTGCQCLFVVV